MTQSDGGVIQTMCLKLIVDFLTVIKKKIFCLSTTLPNQKQKMMPHWKKNSN